MALVGLELAVLHSAFFILAFPKCRSVPSRAEGIAPAPLMASFEWANASGGWIDTVANLAVFPNLQTLDLWEDNLLNLDLTGCSSLLNVRVAGNFESQINTDNWLNQVAAAATNEYGVFFYNSPNVGCWADNNSISNPITVGSPAYTTLAGKNWTISAWGCSP